MPSCDMDPNVLEINDICVINEFYYITKHINCNGRAIYNNYTGPLSSTAHSGNISLCSC